MKAVHIISMGTKSQHSAEGIGIMQGALALFILQRVWQGGDLLLQKLLLHNVLLHQELLLLLVAGCRECRQWALRLG